MTPSARFSRRQFVKLAATATVATPLAQGCANDDAWSASRLGVSRLSRFGGRAEPLLFSAYPSLRRLPWLALVDGPTPIEPLDRLAAVTGLDNLWIKRDDLTSTVYGGNKVRKHEFLLADALARDRNHVVTVGGIGSHHCCSTAAFASQLGLTTTLVQSPQPVTPHVQNMLRWDAVYNPRFRLAANPVTQVFATIDELRWAESAGQRPYFIWAGGSTPYGTLSYLNAGLEFAAQLQANAMPMPEAIYVATGSGGTQAGLTAAMKLLNLPIRVAGVRVVPWPATTAASIAWLANRMLHGLAALEQAFAHIRLNRDDIHFVDGYLGAGYGAPTDLGERTKTLLAETHGIPLETTYTAKALAAMLDEAKHWPDHGPLLFWDTYNSAPPPPLPPAETLPAEYQKFFRAPA